MRRGSYRGTLNLTWRTFAGCLVLDTDASELVPGTLSEAINVDCLEEVIKKRLGKAVFYTAPAGAGAVVAIGAKYPADGSAPTVLYARGTLGGGGTPKLFKANTEIGNLEASSSGYYDLIQFRDRMYVAPCRGVTVGLQKLNATLDAISAVTALAEPPSGEGSGQWITVESPVIETFDAAAGWTAVNGPQAGASPIAAANNNTFHKEGVACLQVDANAATDEGSYIYKAFSSANPDLSQMQELVLWVRGNGAGIQFQVVIYKNGQVPGTHTPVWDAFPISAINTAEEWEQVRIPLAGIPATERTASPGLAIRFLDNATVAYPVNLCFDHLQPQSGMEAGRYRYFYAYYDSVNDKESKPSDARIVDTGKAQEGAEVGQPDRDVPFKQLFGAVATNVNEPNADQIRLYRYLEGGPLERPRLLQTLPHGPGASTVAAGLPVAAGDLTINVTSATALLGLDSTGYILVGTEVMQVTAKAVNVLTVVRGQLGTTPKAHVAGTDIVRLRTWTDTKSTGQLAIDDTREMVKGTRTVPLAVSWALVNNRLLALDGQTAKLLLSAYNKPEEFIPDADTNRHPDAAGEIGLPGGDQGLGIRVVEWNGMAVVFTDRGVYTLQGTQWPSLRQDVPITDPFKYRKRADVGLDARGAVAVTNQAIYFLSHDGARVLLPSRVEGEFECFLISEGVGSEFRKTRPGFRKYTTAGVDERGRIHFSYAYGFAAAPDRALIFDPRADKALQRGSQPQRSGWTHYKNWGHTAYYRLKHGAGHFGQLLGGHPTSGKVFLLHLDSTGVELQADEGGPIAWSFVTPVADPFPARDAAASLAFAEFAPASGETITFRILLDRAAREHSVSKSLGTDSSRLIPVEARLPASVVGHYLQLGVGGVQSVPMTVHACGLAVTPR